MKVDSRDSGSDSGAGNPRLARGGTRVCPICNSLLAADDAGEYCAVCVLRRAIGGAGDSGEAVGSFDSGAERGFGHYELVLNEDGSAVELGRGAMGVTYKAFDPELRCPVALKEIGERHLGDEVALRRFLREARAAASLRHPNVASVFHLGRTSRSYFYAMEYVEGETLERFIKRSGSLEVALALDIALQVAAGLAAIHRKQLIHRDIKPANIMISFEERGAPRVKIIDLGLAKSLNDSQVESAVSAPGAFAGTPEFASPEQFVGSSVDIRSDLYSLGVTLWDMVTGQVPFRGTPVEVMYQHRDTSPPTEQLKSLPQPTGLLLEVLLEKNPNHRFQTPAELLEALEAVKSAIHAGRRMMKTIRVNLLASGDVQKERNVADRLMHSIAAESNLPVSAAEINFQRLVEADLAFQTNLPDGSRAQPGNVVVCLSFSQEETTEDETVGNQVPRGALFDLVICIVWARLDPLANSILMVANRAPDEPKNGLEITATEEDGAGGPADLRLIVYRNCNDPILPLPRKEERDEFGRRWDAVQEFLAALENRKPGELSATVTNYRSLQDFEEIFRKDFRRFLASRLGEDGGQAVSRPKVRRWQSSPFRGLNLFGFEHSPIFYGRTKSVGEVLEAVEAQVRVGRPFVIVVGPSGSGKSSLVQAGVLPLLTQPGTIEGIGLWRRAVTRPGAGGSGGDCFDTLAAALLEPAGLPALQDAESTDGTRDLARELRDHADSVALRVRDALDHAAREWKIEHRFQLEQQERQLRASGRHADADLVRKRAERIEVPKTRLALVVDQLEELFTTGFSPQIRQAYVSAIADLARSGRVYVLATLRSDFYSSYQQFPELIELTKPSGKVDLRPPSSHEIGEIIRLPAEAAGLSFEEEPASGHRLDEALRDVASATPESLPLLEHVLSLLYDEQAIRGDHILRWSDYRELGELKGALAQHADRVFAMLQPEEQAAFPLVMRYLVTLGQGEEEVPNRRTVPCLDFVPPGNLDDHTKLGAKGFIDRFIQARLLVADTDPHGEITVSVAHEALLREWQRVREWLSENREFLRMRDRLEASLKLWLSRGRQKDDLLRPGLALAEGEKLAADYGPSLSEQQSSYIRASIIERARLRAAQERARYRVMGGITAALVVAVAFGIVSFRQYRRAEGAKLAATRAAKAATVARDEAEKLIAFMTVDLREKLRPIGRLDLLDEVSRRVKMYYSDFGNGSGEPESLRYQSIAYVNDADNQKDLGDLGRAFSNYELALGTQRKLTSQDPKNSQWAQDLSVTLEKIGDVLLAQENVAQALASYQESFQIRQKLVANSQIDLSLSYADIGDISGMQGNSDDALKNYRSALDIIQPLAEQSPSDANLRRYLANCLAQIGHELAARGDLNGALSVYRQSLAITQSLADKENDTNTQRDLSINLERVGDVFQSKGELSDALANYQQALSIRKLLVLRDKRNVLWQGDLSWSYQEIGDVLLAQHNAKQALESYQSAFEIVKRLTEIEPRNNEWQSNRAIACEKEGEALEALGQLANALEQFRNSSTIYEGLVQRDRKNVEWSTGEALGLLKAGMILAQLGPEHRVEAKRLLIRVRGILLSLQDSFALDVPNKERLTQIQLLLGSL
jgi:serine/threonine protein kinase/tetratricopeptide (TPR) repeat protein